MRIEELDQALHDLAIFAEAQAQLRFEEALRTAERIADVEEAARVYKQLSIEIADEQHKIYVEGVYALMQQVEDGARPSAWQVMSLGAIVVILAMTFVVAVLGWLVWMQS